jgi:hypothetical protein
MRAQHCLGAIAVGYSDGGRIRLAKWHEQVHLWASNGIVDTHCYRLGEAGSRERLWVPSYCASEDVRSSPRVPVRPFSQ